MAGKRILSDAQIEEMITLREKGWDPKRIAKWFTDGGTPVSAGSVSWQCLVAGADAPPRLRGRCVQPSQAYRRGKTIVRPFSAEEDTLLRVLDMQGFKMSVISRRMDRAPNSCRGRLLTLARHEQRAEDAIA